MDANAFGTLEIAGYALAAVCAIAAVVVFFTQHIREVRDEMTGRAAVRAIEELRAGRTGVARVLSAGKRGGAGQGVPGARHSAGSARTSGSLHVRMMADDAAETEHMEESELGTTLLRAEDPAQQPASTGTGAAAEESEAGTTLLGGKGPSDEEAPSEAGTTLLKNDEPSEAGTSLLGDDEPSEAGTTLLTKGGAR